MFRKIKKATSAILAAGMIINSGFSSGYTVYANEYQGDVYDIDAQELLLEGDLWQEEPALIEDQPAAENDASLGADSELFGDDSLDSFEEDLLILAEDTGEETFEDLASMGDELFEEEIERSDESMLAEEQPANENEVSDPVSYPITTKNRTVSIDDIADALKASGRIASDFEPSYAAVLKGSVQINETKELMTVTVGSGGERDTDLIRIYDLEKASTDFIDVYVYSNQARIDEVFTSALVRVRWNDDLDISARPVDVQDKNQYTLYFELDASGERYPIEKLFEMTGLNVGQETDPEEEPETEETTFELIQKLNSALSSDAYLEKSTADGTLFWMFDLSDLGLPKKYTIDGIPHTINYCITQNTPYEGYTCTSISLTYRIIPVKSNGMMIP